MKKETQELVELINDYVNGNKSYQRQPFDSNHWFMTNFRLYIDGSYSYPGNEPGFKFAERLKTRLREINKLKPDSANSKLRSLTIEMFMNLLAVECPELSRSTIQKTIVKYFKPKDLELLNHHLVDDLNEYYNENK